MPSTFLLTGGAGFIGSHMAAHLLERGQDVVVLDDLSNSHAQVFDRIKQITGRAPAFVQGDIRDSVLLEKLFKQFEFHAVIHFAGLKSVDGSVSEPGLYYDVNVGGSAKLILAMEKAGVYRLIFSSSATVYADRKSDNTAYDETAPTGPSNPYGRTKMMVETMLNDVAAADERWAISLLRYFNPAGGHASGLLGEAPSGKPSNLVPYILQVLSGEREVLNIFGDDYPTPDGTALRDYIHVEDLIDGHVAALDALATKTGLHVFNLGTGTATSVREMVAMFEKVTGQTVPARIAARRAGDVAQSLADPTKAQAQLGWKARRDLKKICEDSWRWQQNKSGS